MLQCLEQGEVSHTYVYIFCLPGGSDDKESVCNELRPGFNLWVGNIPWRRAWQPTPVFLPGESHEQRSMAGYSSWGHKESDMTERLSTF